MSGKCQEKKIKLLQELGQGSFGMVYKGEYETGDKHVFKSVLLRVPICLIAFGTSVDVDNIGETTVSPPTLSEILGNGS
ncbi:hypothetical protein CEXT_309901 [Caerostris extrusa]|uniref:Uncharacterized protein n=1 Tax=Caerostris extrusa TaxID=172846 RepID=A0AAV4UGF1_CAEEX|nr:hypothetical protein CEXT_309901 [Caerostris extrusa]